MGGKGTEKKPQKFPHLQGGCAKEKRKRCPRVAEPRAEEELGDGAGDGSPEHHCMDGEGGMEGGMPRARGRGVQEGPGLGLGLVIYKM